MHVAGSRDRASASSRAAPTRPLHTATPIVEVKIRVLNVAGNRESKAMGIGRGWSGSWRRSSANGTTPSRIAFMCGRYTLKTSAEVLAEHFELPKVPW